MEHLISLLHGNRVLQIAFICLLAAPPVHAQEELYTSRDLTPPGGFKSPEGPAVDAEGVLYAVNFHTRGTIGRVTPEGVADIFVELANGSIGNGIRFDSQGAMLIADWKNHNILKVARGTQVVTTLAHEPAMNQPNDIAIGADDLVYASDPNWAESTGHIWRVGPEGRVDLLETGMGTTNGIEVSPDEKTLYVNESIQRNVWAYDLARDGEISNKRLLIQFADFGMDGMRCDIDGNLYITRHGKVGFSTEVTILSAYFKALLNGFRKLSGYHNP